MSPQNQSRHKFDIVCRACGSLTIVFPAGANPEPQSILKCGRCGSGRGSLQSLRDSSLGPQIAEV